MLKIHETMRRVMFTKCAHCGHPWMQHPLKNKSANPTGLPGPQHCISVDGCNCRTLIFVDEDPALCHEVEE